MSFSTKTNEDGWVHSTCQMCFASCGIKVRREKGIAIKLEGDPDCPDTNGRLCAKGNAGLISVYDPYRVKVPLRRTNPVKGMGVDAGWKEITWEEALTEIVARLNALRQDDPRKLMVSTFDTAGLSLAKIWATAFGTPNYHWTGYFCGNYLHSAMYLTNGTFHSDVDLDYCKYCILLGNQHGFMVGLGPNHASQKMVEARMRGMKVVVVDPIGTNAAAKADEWVPIRPGTDGALVLGWINLLINELGLYDAHFLKRRTNAPYLVLPEGKYARDKETGKPLVWDTAEGKAKPFDAPAKDVALEGTFSYKGVNIEPAFQRLKEHVKSYDPEGVAKITSIPAETIRRMAREFGEAAQLGATIAIDGKVFPLRPAAINIYRGAGAHKHGVAVALAVQTMNMIVGAFYVPGGHRGVNLIGPFESWSPGMNADGLIRPPAGLGHRADYYDFEVGLPQTMEIRELLPISTNRSPMCQLSLLYPESFKLPYRVEALIVSRRNLMMNNVNIKDCAEALQRIPFVVVFATHLYEVTDFADLVLPDSNYLERLDLFPTGWTTQVSPGTGHFYWGIRQPVMAPAGQCQRWIDVMWEIAARVGFLPELNLLTNLELNLKDPYKLEPSKRYSWEEIYDREAKSVHGRQKGLDWFKAHGFFKVARKVEEQYPGMAIASRFPLYFENIKRAGEAVKQATRALGLDWDTASYQSLPHWRPCPAYQENSSQYDLYATNFKIPIHFFSHTTQNPWLNELAEHHPYAYKIHMNTQTAQQKGIKDGDLIQVESVAGRVQGQVKVTDCIHPEVLGIAGVFGSWAKGKPVARGKGVHYNSLLPLTLERIDHISSGVDSCVRVKVTKVK